MGPQNSNLSRLFLYNDNFIILSFVLSPLRANDYSRIRIHDITE